MKDLTLSARALDLGIPEADLERIRPALETLERLFAPLRASLSSDVEPAVVFHAAEDGL